MQLDTHILLEALVDDPRLPQAARSLIIEPENDVFLSAASIWENAIKHTLSRGDANMMPISGPAALAHCVTGGYQMLSITAAQAAAVCDLPPLHRDPYDHILVAQAKLEPLRLITRDTAVRAYDAGNILV